MALMGKAVLAIWNDVAPGGEAEFNHWHTKEHVPARVGIPGFLRGRRYEALSGSPRYFTLYETESVETLGSAAYLKRLDNPTPWTRRALPLFRHTKRTACRIIESLGAGIGGTLGTLDIGPQAGREDELRAWLTATTLPAIADRPGIVGAHLGEADVTTTRAKAKTQEAGLQQDPDVLARWVLLIEGLDRAIVESACGDFLNADAITRHGAAPDAILVTYRLVYALAK